MLIGQTGKYIGAYYDYNFGGKRIKIVGVQRNGQGSYRYQPPIYRTDEELNEAGGLRPDDKILLVDWKEHRGDWSGVEARVGINDFVLDEKEDGHGR